MKRETFLTGLLSAVALAGLGVYFGQDYLEASRSKEVLNTVQEARIMANGDLLYHDVVYQSVQEADGSYNFSENFTYVKPWLKQADLAIGDFEGTISEDYPLSGYPLFNAPKEVASAIKGAGYGMVDLAHNHILDSGLEGLKSTADTFSALGIQPIGVYPDQARVQAPLVIKELNGIRVAFLGYAYGFNGLESELDPADYQAYLSDLDKQQMETEIKRAEKEADFTIVMPQMGEEYSLEPSQEQKELYQQMVEWGADVVLGGHPHVPQPTQTIQKDGEDKFIIYSMGNFLSNQRIETLSDVTENAKWTERGVLVDLKLKKDGSGTHLESVTGHPSWVLRQDKWGDGSAYLYQTLIAEDFLPGGRFADSLDAETQARLQEAYEETNELLAIGKK